MEADQGEKLSLSEIELRRERTQRHRPVAVGLSIFSALRQIRADIYTPQISPILLLPSSPRQRDRDPPRNPEFDAITDGRKEERGQTEGEPPDLKSSTHTSEVPQANPRSRPEDSRKESL